uniref:DNA polymerase alpha subunit B n=1 Tax=Globisporangium ultimum (strain ATCC 200006 / CBS 805.95 / DAOM BR144) TaxID=431595 RepID=K3WK16_GLOUD
MDHDAEAIRSAFAACNLEVADDAVGTCISICGDFALTADELAAQWDAYSMNNQMTGAADVDKLAGFRSSLAQQKAKDAAVSSSSVSASQKRRTPVIKREIKVEDTKKLDALYTMKSPEPKNKRSFASPPGNSNKIQRTNSMFSPSSLQSPPGNTYEKRTDAGKTVSEFNAHLKKQLAGIDTTSSPSAPRVEFKAPFPDRNLSSNFSYMYTPLFQRAMALDDQIVEYEELVKEHFKIEELQAVADPTPAQVTVVGRIVCEATEGKLNASVVQLEGSRKTCGGQRVLLDLSGVPNFQIFPGKIVALEGIFADVRNPMIVKRFLDPIPAPMAKTPKLRMNELQGDDTRPVRVLTACGPFTTANNVQYLPLNDLLQIAVDQKPDVLVLVGPFIDSMHLSFQDGLVLYDGMMLSFEDIFLFQIMTLIDKVFATNKDLQVVLVPSLRDAHHEMVYPQPPFNKKKVCEAFGAPEYAKRIHLMPNPCTFSINGVVIGVSALDVVVQLSSNELYRAQARDQNRLLRLCEQVIDQRSYYPIFPPPAGSEAPIDLRYMKQFQFEKTPDILLLPSILNRFCGRVQDTICINPGQLCKGESGGTFASLTIFPLAKDKLSNTAGDEIPHFVPDRTMVEIKRI